MSCASPAFDGHKLYKTVVTLFATVLTLAFLFALSQPERLTRRIVLSLLRNVPSLFLVSSRSDQLCVTQLEEGNWLWGTRKGMASIEIRTHLGVVLHKLKPGDIRVNGATSQYACPNLRFLMSCPTFVPGATCARPPASNTYGIPCAAAPSVTNLSGFACQIVE